MIKDILELGKNVKIIKEDDVYLLEIMFKSKVIFKRLGINNLQGLNNMKANLEDGLLDSLIDERIYSAMAITIK